MSRRPPLRTALLAAAALVALPGCYRATLLTGLRPASEVRERVWSKPFSVANASVAEIGELGGCPTGVAKVETTRTVFDQIAGLFDGGANAGTRLLITCAVALPADSTVTDSVPAPRTALPDSARASSSPELR